MLRSAITLLLAAIVIALAAAPAGAALISLPSVRFDGAAPFDRAGEAVAPAGDVNGDGYRDVVIGAPRALPTRGDGAVGMAYVVFGPFKAGTTIDLANLGSRGFVMIGAPAPNAGQAGVSVASAGDVNGDGLGDVIVSAPAGGPGSETPMSHAGQAYIVFGSRAPHAIDLGHLGADGIVLTGTTQFFTDAFGFQVAGVGDVNRDGLDDVAVAAPGNQGYEDDFTRGRAYVIFGRRTPGEIRMARLGRAGFSIGPGVPGEMTSVAGAGDVNRDGRADIAVMDGEGLRGAGAVWIVYGRAYRQPIDLRRLGRNGLLIHGSHVVHYSLMGGSVAGGADVNGDRRPDVVIGAPEAHGRFTQGAAWVVPGTTSRRPIDLRRPGRRAWECAIGGLGWRAGRSIALGRVNGDRLGDVVFGARGHLAVVFGSASHRSVRLDALPRSRGFVVDGRIEPPPSGAPGGTGGFAAVAVAGDLNGDGHADLLAGAPRASHNGRENAGSAYLFFSP